MQQVTLRGDIHEFKAKAPKEGQTTRLINKLCLTVFQPEDLAMLCKDVAAVGRAIRAVQQSRATLEQPCDGQEAVISCACGQQTHKAGIVLFDKFKLNCSDASALEAEVYFSEPANEEACLFYLRTLGTEMGVEVEPAQDELPLEDKPEVVLSKKKSK